MSGVKDFLFGDPDDKSAMRWQQAANRENQRFAQESTALARQDLLDVFPRAQESLQQANRAAIDVARKAPQSQIRALSRAGTNAQKALMGGMNAYQNAIMGSPTGISGDFGQNPAGLRPVAIGMSEFVQAGRPFYGTQQPHFLGTQKRDWEEFTMRKNNPDDFWGLARPAAAPNLFPEQYRKPIRYNFGSNVATGGDVNRAAPTYANSLAGAPPAGLAALDGLTWSGR